jgi:type II secretory ATPase GspE/PulE/Tfp pilus assembly ATPase PilB-like protein
MGVENFLLSSTVRGILAQRLVRSICPACKEVDRSVANEEELSALGLRSGIDLYRGKGCEQCASTGFFGRVGIFELLVVEEDIRTLILKNADASQLRESARRNGMRTLFEDGAEKIREGVTTLSELLRVTQEA